MPVRLADLAGGRSYEAGSGNTGRTSDHGDHEITAHTLQNSSPADVRNRFPDGIGSRLGRATRDGSIQSGSRSRKPIRQIREGGSGCPGVINAKGFGAVGGHGNVVCAPHRDIGGGVRAVHESGRIDLDREGDGQDGAVSTAQAGGCQSVVGLELCGENSRFSRSNPENAGGGVQLAGQP